MVPSNKTILRWELAGIAFVFLLGALLHFVFGWSGESWIVGAIAPVNESVWEHFKLGFWPMCLWTAIEYRVLQPLTRNFLPGKAVAVYMTPIVTGIMFYAYKGIVGRDILIVDIIIFALAVTIGQLTSYRITTSRPLPGYANPVALALILLLASMLIVTTFYPPHLPIFMDNNTGAYGLPQ